MRTIIVLQKDEKEPLQSRVRTADLVLEDQGSGSFEIKKNRRGPRGSTYVSGLVALTALYSDEEEKQSPS